MQVWLHWLTSLPDIILSSFYVVCHVNLDHYWCSLVQGHTQITMYFSSGDFHFTNIILVLCLYVIYHHRYSLWNFVLYLHVYHIDEKTQLRSAKRWKCITRLINKSETTVMVSCLIPHRSLNILLCSYFCPSSVNSSTCSYSCPSSVDSVTVFSFLSVFHQFLV